MTSREQILAYILKFAREDNLDELEDFLTRTYPSCDEFTGYNNIPTKALYAAVDSIETAREENETREVRALYQHYDKIYALPKDILADLSIATALPRNKVRFDHTNVEQYPFAMNILTCVNHPLLQNIYCVSTSSRDITVLYIPDNTTASIDAEMNKPTVLSVTPAALSSVPLSAQILLTQNNNSQTDVDMYLCMGLIDGSFQVFFINTFTLDDVNSVKNKAVQFNPLKNVIPFITTNTANKWHQKYLTKIAFPTQSGIIQDITQPIKLVTGSHDQTVAVLKMDFTQKQITLEKSFEFSGKIESICGISTPHVLQQTSAVHPVKRYPTLVPTQHHSRYHLSKIRKLQKGTYTDNVEFVTQSIPFKQQTDATYNNLYAVSVRNDAMIHFIDIDDLCVVDTMNMNITGDTHISFTVLDMAYDLYHGILYMATDSNIILVMDLITKQHIRRLYSTDNNEMSSPILKLLYVDNKSNNLTNNNNNNNNTQADDEVDNILLKFPKTVVAVTTGYNNVKLYNPGTCQQIIEYQCNTKNIKSFTMMQTKVSGADGNECNQISLITTGFDKAFTVHY